MTTTSWVVTVTQNAIDAPDFPRSAEWWRGFLPLWVAVPFWWRIPKPQWDQSTITVDPDSGQVLIFIDDRAHAKDVAEWVASSAVGRRGAAVTYGPYVTAAAKRTA